ncbi:hypothetical protein MIMGU_mgv1a0004951mg, partial [Erythranthe guttata]
MDYNSISEINENPYITKNPSSQRSISSVQSIQTNSSTEQGGPKPLRYGSVGPDSMRLSTSYRDINEEEARLVYVNDPHRTNSNFQFAGNSIKTSKYSILTFLPRNLFEQFRRIAYLYFLVIAILNQLPQLAVFGRGASILPLAFVLLVTAVKDLYEDYRRHRSDKIENNRLSMVLSSESSNNFQTKKWKHIRVGDIIK